MVINISTSDVKLKNETYIILRSIKHSRIKSQSFDDVVMELLNRYCNSNPDEFLKVCKRGGLDIQIPAMTNAWYIPANKGVKPRQIDLRRAVVKYAIEKGDVVVMKEGDV